MQLNAAISFDGVHGPVVCLASRAEMPCQRTGLILSRVQCETERLHTPAVRDVELRHQCAWAPSLMAAASARLARLQTARMPYRRAHNDVKIPGISRTARHPPRRRPPQPTHNPARLTQPVRTPDRIGRTGPGAPPPSASPIGHPPQHRTCSDARLERDPTSPTIPSTGTCWSLAHPITRATPLRPAHAPDTYIRFYCTPPTFRFCVVPVDGRTTDRNTVMIPGF